MFYTNEIFLTYFPVYIGIYVKNKVAAPLKGNNTSYNIALFLLLSTTCICIMCYRVHVLLEHSLFLCL